MANKKLSKEEAAMFLGNVDPSCAFWVNDGRMLHSLSDLSEALKNMSDETFKHHVNKEKNDFSNWVNDIIKDYKLAAELIKSKNKTSAYKKVQARLSMLKKKAK